MEDRLSAVEGITAAISSRSVGGEGYLDEREMAITDSSLPSSFGGRALRARGISEIRFDDPTPANSFG